MRQGERRKGNGERKKSRKEDRRIIIKVKKGRDYTAVCSICETARVMAAFCT